ncbi:MAG: hypothetical protein M1832_001952 [Thelocarpon impressellum]|nr:MAG: hypothetical protein M1832_001952 [Thelocarpon impressellum]
MADQGCSSLVSCSGLEIRVRRLNIEAKRFENVSTYELRSPSTYMTVKEPFIHVTTVDDSVITLKLEGDKIFPYFSDQAARSGQSHLALPGSSIILATDKETSVVGLWNPPKRRNRYSADVMFEVELPVSMIRLRFAAVRPIWQPRAKLPGVLRYGTDRRKDQDILGNGVDGSLRQFTLISEAAWRLLRFVQNLCTRSDKVCPYGDRLNRRNHIEPRAELPRFKHVNGDILARLLEPRLGASMLRELLRAESSSRSSGEAAPDFDTPVARYERFGALADDLFGAPSKDPVADTMDYLGKLLEPIF